MNIRPIDLQVLIPRTMDVAKTAAVSEQQPITQQQQLADQLKQSVAEQQRQVQTTLSSQHEGKVTTENLDREKQKKHQHGEERDRESSSDTNPEPVDSKSLSSSVDPVRGHTIDIKT